MGPTPHVETDGREVWGSFEDSTQERKGVLDSPGASGETEVEDRSGEISGGVPSRVLCPI